MIKYNSGGMSLRKVFLWSLLEHNMNVNIMKAFELNFVKYHLFTAVSFTSLFSSCTTPILFYVFVYYVSYKNTLEIRLHIRA